MAHIATQPLKSILFLETRLPSPKLYFEASFAARHGHLITFPPKEFGWERLHLPGKSMIYAFLFPMKKNSDGLKLSFSHTHNDCT